MFRKIFFVSKHQSISFSSSPTIFTNLNFFSDEATVKSDNNNNNNVTTTSTISSSLPSEALSKTKRLLKMLNVKPAELERLRHNMRKAGFRSKRSPKSVNTSWSSFHLPSPSSKSRENQQQQQLQNNSDDNMNS